MKPNLLVRPVNGLFDDPCLYVRIRRERRAMLFDAGDLSGLSPQDLFKISDVFISHTHMDHFAGFDGLLRAVLRRERPLNVYGPRGIIRSIEGKLRAYAWNLIRDYPATLRAFSYDGRQITTTVYRAANAFKRESAGSVPSDGTLLKDDTLAVRAAVTDHGIPCLAFSVEESLQINIDRDKLLKMGLQVGPWLADLKKALRKAPRRPRSVSIEGKRFPVSSLKGLAIFSPGQKISYVTDTSAADRNMRRIVSLVKGSDILFCEAYFAEADRERARERFHLTARDCGKLAREAGVGKLVLIHGSPKYRDRADLLVREAQAEFGKCAVPASISSPADGIT